MRLYWSFWEAWPDRGGRGSEYGRRSPRTQLSCAAQYAAVSRFGLDVSGILDRPPSPSRTVTAESAYFLRCHSGATLKRQHTECGTCSRHAYPGSECKNSPGEIVSAFETLVSERIGALVVSGENFFLTQHNLMIELAARQPASTIYAAREFVLAGGLMSYRMPQDESHHAEPPKNRSTMMAYQKLVRSPLATLRASSDPITPFFSAAVNPL